MTLDTAGFTSTGAKHAVALKAHRNQSSPQRTHLLRRKLLSRCAWVARLAAILAGLGAAAATVLIRAARSSNRYFFVGGQHVGTHSSTHAPQNAAKPAAANGQTFFAERFSTRAGHAQMQR